MSPSYEVFFVILLFFGICNSVIDISMNTHASIIEQKLGKPMMSWFHAAFSFGGMAGAGRARNPVRHTRNTLETLAGTTSDSPQGHRPFTTIRRRSQVTEATGALHFAV